MGERISLKLTAACASSSDCRADDGPMVGRTRYRPGPQGRAMPSGTYIVRLESDSGVEARKVMLVR